MLFSTLQTRLKFYRPDLEVEGSGALVESPHRPNSQKDGARARFPPAFLAGGGGESDAMPTLNRKKSYPAQHRSNSTKGLHMTAQAGVAPDNPYRKGQTSTTNNAVTHISSSKFGSFPQRRTSAEEKR